MRQEAHDVLAVVARRSRRGCPRTVPTSSTSSGKASTKPGAWTPG